MFLPTTKEELNQLKWDKLDIILVTGDTYLDSPSCGSAVIGKVLLDQGFKVGIIAQPECHSPQDIMRLGEPLLYWGVTAGAVDSLVSNYTATGKRRHKDDLTPGGENNRRPDRALIVYTNLIRQYFKNTVPIVLGGLEASLRRVAHYDFWKDKLCRSVLFDAKADLLIYGMGEHAACALAKKLRAAHEQNSHTSEQEYTRIPGLCYTAKEKQEGYLELPSFEAVNNDPKLFIDMFRLFYQQNDPRTAAGLSQQHGDRYLIQNPPQPPLTGEELDHVYNLSYERDAHPYYKQMGVIRALDTIQFSITTHRGCFGECNFCAIAVHQGRRVCSRSHASIIREAKEMIHHPGFKGIINDLGGPTANMYGIECARWKKQGPCADKRCLFPAPCTGLNIDHSSQIELFKKVRSLPGVKKVFVASGIRYDLLMADDRYQTAYLTELVQHHVSGQLKVAPEHSSPAVLDLMGKGCIQPLLTFKQEFDQLNKQFHKEQFLTYYFLVAHPGCNFNAMSALKEFIRKHLRLQPEQVQIFTPTPSTYSTLMYATGLHPFTKKPVFVERKLKEKLNQKALLTPPQTTATKREPATHHTRRPLKTTKTPPKKSPRY